MRTKELNPRLFQGDKTLAVLNAKGSVVETFTIEGLQSVNINIEGRWFEIRRNLFPTDATFSLYELILIHGTA
jgi:hypothetical protein